MCALPHSATEDVRICLAAIVAPAAMALKVMDRAAWTLMNVQATSAVCMQIV